MIGARGQLADAIEAMGATPRAPLFAGAAINCMPKGHAYFATPAPLRGVVASLRLSASPAVRQRCSRYSGSSIVCMSEKAINVMTNRTFSGAEASRAMPIDHIPHASAPPFMGLLASQRLPSAKKAVPATHLSTGAAIEKMKSKKLLPRHPLRACQLVIAERPFKECKRALRSHS